MITGTDAFVHITAVERAGLCTLGNVRSDTARHDAAAKTRLSRRGD